MASNSKRFTGFVTSASAPVVSPELLRQSMITHYRAKGAVSPDTRLTNQAVTNR